LLNPYLYKKIYTSTSSKDAFIKSDLN